jgi:hypothetical protein
MAPCKGTAIMLATAMVGDSVIQWGQLNKVKSANMCHQRGLTLPPRTCLLPGEKSSGRGAFTTPEPSTTSVDQTRRKAKLVAHLCLISSAASRSPSRARARRSSASRRNWFASRRWSLDARSRAAFRAACSDASSGLFPFIPTTPTALSGPSRRHLQHCARINRQDSDQQHGRLEPALILN